MRVLIVDDEPLARERIRALLADEPDVELVGECADGEAAVGAIEQHRPDLVFLDVQMPGMNGFDVLRTVEAEHLPNVIFVTAYDQHALAAFEVHAVDYLLKPFKQSRFKAALQRARELLERRQTGGLDQRLRTLLAEQKPQYVSRLAVRTPERILFVRADQIDWIEAAGNYVVLHAGKENHILRETLGALEASLDPERFIRISRSALVNVDRIKELQPLFKGEYAVVLHDGRQLTMTRGLREVQDLLKFS